MTTLMKSNQPHWLGNKFVPIGTVLPEGHSEAIPAFYEPYEVEDPAPARDVLQARARELGINRVGNKSDETLAREIAAAEGGIVPGDAGEVERVLHGGEEVSTLDDPRSDDGDASTEEE